MGNTTATAVQVSAKSIQLKNYTIHEQLGNGAFGTVFKASKKGHAEMVAIKVVPITQGDENWKKEAEAAKQLSDHTNIVNIYNTKQKGCNFYIIMELCEGGDLNNYIIKNGKSTSMKERLGFMRDIAEGIEYLHGIKVIHRDIKPQNVLITTQRERKICKLGDFGLAQIEMKADHYFTSIVGTKIYAAPEVFSELTPKYSYPADIFSLGALYHAITLVYIVADREDKLHLIPAMSDGGKDSPVISVVREERLVYPAFVDKYNKSDSEELGQLVFLMIQKNPKIRPDIGAVVRSLKRIGAQPEKEPWEETMFDLKVLLQKLFDLKDRLPGDDGGAPCDDDHFQTAKDCTDDSGIH